MKKYGFFSFIIIKSTWGVLTLTWYTYMCLPFGVLFREI